MNFRSPIQTQEDFEATSSRAASLMESLSGSPEEAELGKLAGLIMRN